MHGRQAMGLAGMVMHSSTAIGCSAAGWRVHALLRTCRAQCLWMAVMSSSRVPLCMSRSLCTALYRRREAVCTQTEHAECLRLLALCHSFNPLQVLRVNLGSRRKVAKTWCKRQAE